jgi:aspartokinase
LVFKKNANFFAENWEKSQKIVIVTSTPAPATDTLNRVIEAAVASTELSVLRLFKSLMFSDDEFLGTDG